jgi:hypothetical protein
MNFTPIFVGGGWRSGTTVLHALLCTSPRANDYINECSHFMYLFNAYINAEQQFQFHGQFYFRDRQHMRDVYSEILSRELERIWAWLNKPELLVLKSPPMTGRFPLLGKMIPETRFVVAVRDPRDVVASRLEVVRKLRGTPDIEKAVRAECAEYKQQYAGLLAGAMGTRLCIVEYEKLVGGDLSVLRGSGFGDIDPARIWDSNVTDMRKAGGGAYITPLYGAALSDSSVGRYRETLDAATQELVMNLCGELAQSVREHTGAERGDSNQ